MKSEVQEAAALYGIKSRTDIDLLILMGIKEEAARELLTRCDNSLGQLSKLTPSEISETKGIGYLTATALTAALEIGRRRETERPTNKEQITSSADAYQLLAPGMRDEIQEVFKVIYMDRRSKVIKIEEIARGGMSACIVDPKIVFQKALECKAVSMILSHNHPSGVSSPSNEDIRLTEKLKAAESYIDIKVLDHVIIGDGQYYSFADEGKI